MGRCNFSDVGYGMTEQEALRDAIQTANEEYGHREGYSGHINSMDRNYPMKSKCLVKPKPAKRCKVEKQVCKGARKWETRYCICDFHDYEYGYALTQGEAIKKAKEIALKKNIRLDIEIRKVLVDGNPRIVTIRPEKSQTGKWVFTGIARE